MCHGGHHLTASLQGVEDSIQELARALLLRVADHLGGWTLLQDDAVVGEQHLIGNLFGELDFVRDDDQRPALDGQNP